ncbi:MAG: carboxylesterase/lipase family protein [Methylococcus sp.]
MSNRSQQYSRAYLTASSLLLSRLGPLLLLGFGVLGVGLASADPPPACQTPVVETASGPVCGAVRATAAGDQAEAFLGIPYAGSTAGAQRWQPPKPPTGWKATRESVAFGANCPQTPPSPDRKDTTGPASGESEDCLFLNVWRPRNLAENAKLPVLVFIHGGAFVGGSGADALYDGTYLAAHHRAILVTLNYRLGVLGFLATAGGGNFGLLDQQAALRWVKDNIARFGGDPSKVTVFGESAGGMSVGLHLLSMPASVPLFRAGIIESNFLGVPYQSLEEGARVGEVFMRGLECSDLDCLRRVDVSRLLAAQYQLMSTQKSAFSGLKYTVLFGPVVDGRVVPRQPLATAALAGAQKPLMIGSNRDEMMIFLGGQSTDALAYSSEIARLYPESYTKIVNAYPPRKDLENWQLLAKLRSDQALHCASRHAVRHWHGPVYAYLFSHPPSFQVYGGEYCNNGKYVCHAAELPFVFHTAEALHGQFNPDEAKLSDTILSQWVNFATALDPSIPGDAGTPATAWPKANGPQPRYMVYGPQTGAVTEDPLKQDCALWDQIGYP